MSARVMITGAQGFIGRYLTAALLAAGENVRVVGVGRSAESQTFTHHITPVDERVEAPLPEALRAASNDTRYRYEQADIQDRSAIESLLREYRPERIVHLASGLRDDAPAHLFRTCAEGTIALLEAVADSGLALRSIVIGSSGSVYGAASSFPIAEDARCEPRDIYAVSKLAQEHVSQILARERRLPVVIARIFNVIGPGQDERHVAGRFGAQVAAIAAGQSEARIHIGDPTTTRDFIDVRDVARALIALAEAGEPGSTYNVASGVETRVARILDLLVEIADVHDALTLVSDYARPSDMPRSVADISRLRRTGYLPSIALAKSLADILDYYQATMIPARALDRLDEVPRERIDVAASPNPRMV